MTSASPLPAPSTATLICKFWRRQQQLYAATQKLLREIKVSGVTDIERARTLALQPGADRVCPNLRIAIDAYDCSVRAANISFDSNVDFKRRPLASYARGQGGQSLLSAALRNKP